MSELLLNDGVECVGGSKAERGWVLLVLMKVCFEQLTPAAARSTKTDIVFVTVSGCADTRAQQAETSGFHFDSPIRQTDRQTASRTILLMNIIHIEQFSTTEGFFHTLKKIPMGRAKSK